MLHDQKGFTLKELAMVLAVITLLCVAAIPPFFALQNSRRRTEMEKTVAALTIRLDEMKKQGTAPPAAADANPAQSPCLSCFENLSREPLNNPLWFKFAENVYLYSVDGDTETVAAYQQKSDFKIVYDPAKGVLSAEEIREPSAQ